MKIDLSIIITCFNYENYISKCIESCLNQSSKYKYEIIVLDDGSTDNSSQIIQKYSDKAIIHLNSNKGLEICANFGVSISKGSYFTRLDADDFLKDNFIDSNLDLLNQKKDISFVYSNYDVVNGHNVVQEKSNLPAFSREEICSRGDFLATGTVYRKDDLSTLPYNTNFKNCGLENYELILNLLNKSKYGFLNNQNLFAYRVHEQNMSSNRKDSIVDYGKELFCRLELGDYRTNEYHPYKLTL